MKHQVIDFDFTILLPLITVGLVASWNAIRGRWGIKLILFSTLSTASLIGLLFIGGINELMVAHLVWSAAKYLCVMSGMWAVTTAWESAKEEKWLNFSGCVWVLLLSCVAAQSASRHAWNALRTSDPDYAQYLLHHDPADDPESIDDGY